MWLIFFWKKDEICHNFLKHYQQEGALPFEARPVNINRYDSLNVYSISYEEHHESYNFFDFDNTIENVLNVFCLKFVTTNKKFQIKCNFSIVNSQPASFEGFVELTDTRIWSTKVYSWLF